ncbi:XdhC family protein, partial [Ralstonia pseudosolanacearum]|uniref:XdhC family protein n=1 Tax=Ralstonia pseudosolanacearum TaxID=1310165 RepID=UPI003CE6C5AF
MDHTQLRPFRFADALAAVQAGQPCVLVTVVDVQGSAPREPGTLMLVCADAFFGTIGGGHLEWRAMAMQPGVPIVFQKILQRGRVRSLSCGRA